MVCGNCAKAQGLRESYPDLGGLYIPEEMAKFQEDVTPGGRQIVYQDSPEAGELRRNLVEQKKQALQEAIASPNRPSAKQPEKTLETAPVREWRGTWTLDWTADETSPRLTGDLAECSEILEKTCGTTWGADGFWHIPARKFELLRDAADNLGYKLEQILPKTDSGNGKKEANTVKKQGGTSSPRSASAPHSGRASRGIQTPACTILKGTVEQVNQTNKNGKVYLDILFAFQNGKGITKQSMRVWHQSLWPYFQKAGKCPAELEVSKKQSERGKVWYSVQAIKRLGNVEFYENKPVIDMKTREAGSQRSLY